MVSTQSDTSNTVLLLGLGINQVLANEYLEDSGIGSHVEESG